MPNKVIFSRIQNRRGPLENLPQPLRPGEIALTSDARRLWIGNEDVAPFGIRTLTPAVPVGPTSLIQKSLTERIVSIVFDAELSQLDYEQLVGFLSRENNRLFPPFVAPSKFTLITGHTESDYFGSFSGGSNYNVNDVITLNNGARITVTSETGNVVDGFTIDFRGGEAVAGVPIAQQSVSPTGGTGFILTPQLANIQNAPSPDKATFYNASQQVLWDGKRSVFIGLRVPELELALEKSLTDPTEVVFDSRKGSESYDGAPGNGTNNPGSGYIVNEVITLDNDAEVTVIEVATNNKLIEGETEADYSSSFNGGSGYTEDDVITLENGDIITVTSETAGVVDGFTVTTVNGLAVADQPILAISGGSGTVFNLTPTSSNLELVAAGSIVEFIITSIGSSFTIGDTLTQDSTTGSGIGFTITPGIANVLFNAFEKTIAGILDTLSQLKTGIYAGAFDGGTGYAVNNVITLDNGDKITVNAINGNGSVTQLTVSAANGLVLPNTALEQESVEPTGGIGFSLTPVAADLRIAIPISPTSIRIAEQEFLPQWQGPVTTAKVRNFSNPFLTSIASGNVAKLINLVSASSLLLDSTQNQTDYDNTGDNGTFTGGINYSPGDIITLANGTTVLVGAAPAGSVTLFSIQVQGTQVVDNFPIQQSTVVDSVGDPAPGIGFTLTPRENNLILVVSDETLELVTTVTNIEIGVVDIFDETEFPSDLLFEQFDYQVVLDNPNAVGFPTGIAFPRTQSDSIFIEYTLRSASYAATGNMRLSDFGGAVSVSDQRNANSLLSGDITLTADFIGAGQQIRVLYTNTTGTDDIVLKMIVRRWNSA